MADEKKLSFTQAVDISFIRPKNQRYIAVSIEGQQSLPSLPQAQKLRELDKDGKLNDDVIAGFVPHEAFRCPMIAIGKVHGLPPFGLNGLRGWDCDIYEKCVSR